MIHILLLSDTMTLSIPIYQTAMVPIHTDTHIITQTTGAISIFQISFPDHITQLKDSIKDALAKCCVVESNSKPYDCQEIFLITQQFY